MRLLALDSDRFNNTFSLVFYYWYESIDTIVFKNEIKYNV